MKKILKKQPPAPIPWHPDFRDLTTLPDVKIVRTSFFVNGISVLVLIGLLMLVGYHELERHGVKEEIENLEAQIAKNKARNTEVLRMHNEFRKEARMIEEVSQFVEGSFDFSTFFATLGDSMLPGMKISTVTYQDAGTRNKTPVKELQINGSIVGARDMAASIVTEYVNGFTEHPYFSTVVESAVPTSLVPTQEGDMMAFGIRLTMKAVEAAVENEEKK